MIPYFTTESGGDFTVTVMEVTVEDKKLVVPHNSLAKFIEIDQLSNFPKKPFYDLDDAIKYNRQNGLLICYMNYLDDKDLDDEDLNDDSLYDNFDFIEVDKVDYIRLNVKDKWFDNLQERSISQKGVMIKKWGNFYISHDGIDLLLDADINGLVPF